MQNIVILMGHLTRAPEIKYMPSGTAMAKFGMALNEKWKDKESGELREKVCFVDITCWGRQAEIAEDFLFKGKLVGVEGKLEFNSWETAEGEKRSKLSVRVHRINLIPDGKNGDNINELENGNKQETTPTTTEQVPASTSSEQKPATSTDDDIPF